MMSMEQWWSDTDRGKAEVGGEKPATLSLKIVTYRVSQEERTIFREGVP
jgi:hypothetical protein